ncbi:MAG: glutamine--tRNA ligase/YqeY domain fusion protein [Candidatus Marinimicrobia bacterium]|nr:glutamine--tRNA ligase/YqeY domain fusion protein [Candidatus Neomarinimicrobiota bacterium]
MSDSTTATNFILDIINNDLKTEKYDNRVHTRFPPEPNGYLHIGHAASICLNFGIARDYEGGKCNLRFDDTNPIKEEQEFVDSIIQDVKWLGFDWEDRLFFASDYFDQMYEYAVQLVKSGHAYVDDQTGDQIRQTRGTLKEPGIESPFRNRTPEENLDLLTRMKAGEFEEGSRVLRAKIDMTSPNMNMRDPAMYRILYRSHHRTGNKWCLYPMYDWAHGLEDSIEKITHSICTLEFEDHRPLYDWFLIALGAYRPQQIEFARINVNYTVTSKRKLMQLVTEKHVQGWDDPRMPTISGLRRRGYTPESIQIFCERVGINKRDGVSDIALLDHCYREEMNNSAKRVMAVLDPIKLIITNYPENHVEMLSSENNPEDPEAGTRQIPFTRELYIERTDFMEDPPKKYFRLALGKEVRLKQAYYVTCESVVKDKDGNILEIHCVYDPNTKGGWSQDGRKVRGTLHWVSVDHALDAEVRVYEHLFLKENPNDAEEGKDFISNLNPNSLNILAGCKVEQSLKDATVEEKYQFLRHGYFCVDKDSNSDLLVFNRTVPLRDSWAKKGK